jgi:FtsP/CotA-like multicopper oxidase with cupredoxin domain
MSGFSSNIIKFGGHDMTIVEMDGQATVPTVTKEIMIAAAQRYNVIVTALSSAQKNFAITSAMMPNMFDTVESYANASMNASISVRFHKSYTNIF